MDSERAAAYAKVLDKHYINRCMGAGNALNTQLSAYGLESKGSKKERVQRLAEHMAANDIDVEVLTGMSTR